MCIAVLNAAVPERCARTELSQIKPESYLESIPLHTWWDGGNAPQQHIPSIAERLFAPPGDTFRLFAGALEEQVLAVG